MCSNVYLWHVWGPIQVTNVVPCNTNDQLNEELQCTKRRKIHVYYVQVLYMYIACPSIQTEDIMSQRSLYRPDPPKCQTDIYTSTVVGTCIYLTHMLIQPLTVCTHRVSSWCAHLSMVCTSDCLHSTPCHTTSDYTWSIKCTTARVHSLPCMPAPVCRTCTKVQRLQCSNGRGKLCSVSAAVDYTRQKSCLYIHVYVLNLYVHTDGNANLHI